MLNNSMFTNNTQDTTLVTLSSTNALIENTKFIDNTALYTTHGFQLMSSNLIANNISVTNTLT